MEYTRNCPKCDKILSYKNKYGLKIANTKARLCQKCRNKYKWSLKFNCIHCKKELIFKHPQKIDSIHQCRSCQQQGEKGGFYGKHHTAEFKKILSEKHKKGILGFTKFGSEKNPSSNINKRPVYEIWVEKYGIEKADKRLLLAQEKQSIAASGNKNSMYGKTSPYGTGRGWSGWYRGWFFRSLLELSYMIKVIEKEGLIWESAETKEFMIPYINQEGMNRNYFPDFLVGGNRLIEVKPKRLQANITVLLKKEAAEKFCNKKGWCYELLDSKTLNKEEIITLYNQGKIKFLLKYEEKFKIKYLSQKE
jgi:hypothetical protein